MQPAVDYLGKDLAVMNFAVNYHRWILDMIRPYLGKRCVEVGAGTGSFSEMVMAGDHGPEQLILVEPSAMASVLRQKFDGMKSVDIVDTTFVECVTELRRARPDSVIYINVLEHIQDDAAELDAVFDVLDPGGRVFIFVPALKFLMGPFDRSVGHYRRYRKRELEQKCRRAGFGVRLSRYIDAPGILPWWIKYKLLGSESLDVTSVTLYDRYCIPIIRRVEQLVPPPIGKNLLVVGEKRSSS